MLDRGRVRPELAYAAAVVIVIGLGLRLFWPTLDAGLFSDDYFAVASMDGTLAAPRGSLDLFNFGDGTPKDLRALGRLGSVAWWASPDFRISFLRPLSSALFHVDRALFGENLVAYHAHSIGAWVVLVIAVSLLYRRLLSPIVAALATAMFAFDQSQHGPVTWLCNRGALYAMLLGTLAIQSHLRWRIDRRRGHAWLAVLWLCLGVLLGEWSLPMFAYLAAYEAVGAEDGWRRRALSLVPAGMVALIFLVVRSALGYGARGSDVYVDPAADPMAFLVLMSHRVPILVADMLFGVPASWWDYGSPWRQAALRAELIPPAIWSRLPGWQVFHLTLGVTAVALVAWLCAWTWRGLDDRERRHSRWLVLGSFLALLPVVGAFASTRLTLAAFIGFAPVVALFFREIVRRAQALGRAHFARTLVMTLLGLALVRVQLIAPLRADLGDTVNNFRMSTEWVRAADLDPEQVADQRVFVLAAAEFTTTFFFAYAWGYHHPMPRSFVPLSIAPWPLEVERIADDELVVRTLGGTFMSSAAELHFRSATRPLQAGATVAVEGVRIQATSLLRGKPTVLRMRFDRGLDDPTNVFLASTTRGLERVVMPPVGQTLRLPRAAHPNWMDLERGRYVERIGPLPEILGFVPTPYFVHFDPR